MKVAKEKVWATDDGKLVKDGDEKAAVLVAIKGQEVREETLKDFSNASSFFKNSTDSDDETAKEMPKGEEPKPENREAEQDKKTHKR